VKGERTVHPPRGTARLGAENHGYVEQCLTGSLNLGGGRLWAVAWAFCGLRSSDIPWPFLTTVLSLLPQKLYL
jgi:hypothetical protein